MEQGFLRSGADRTRATSLPHKPPKHDRWSAPQFVYYGGFLIAGLFLSEVWLWTGQTPLRVLFIVASFLMLLIVPGVFLVDLVFPEHVPLTMTQFIGLACVGTIVLDLLVGYILATQHDLYQNSVIMGLGLVSLALIVVAWLLRRDNGRVNDWLAEISFAHPSTKRSVLLASVGVIVFIAAIWTSLSTEAVVYPSVYLSNQKGQLAAYPPTFLSHTPEVSILHVDNQGLGPERYTVEEWVNQKRVWTTDVVLTHNKSWHHPIIFPTNRLGTTHIKILVHGPNQSDYGLNVTYRVLL